MIAVKSAKYLSGHKLWVEFNTGEAGEVDLADLVSNYPAAAPLHDTATFAAFQLDDWPTLVWPCGFDVSPETLYELATGKVPVYLRPSVEMAA
ncbi:MAG: DUF2442 domain-containing protein [Rhodocyclaceae bacterium]|jgi:hypothetical protein|nr:DUF2442 domain-containing protein [Rhodocyclaceae bacterium]